MERTDQPTLSEDDIYSVGIDEAAPQESPVDNQPAEAAPTEQPVEQSVEQPTQPAQPAQQEQQTPPVFKLDAESIKQIKEQLAPPAPQQQPQQQPQLSPEEFDRLTNRFKVSADLLRKIGFEEPTEDMVKGFQEIVDNSARHGFTMAATVLRGQVEAIKQELLNQVQPLQAYYQAQQAKQVEETFYSQNADLANHKEIVRVVAQAALKALPQDVDHVTAMKFVAEETRKILKSSGISVNTAPASGAANPSAPVNNGVPKMNTVHTGGRSQTPSNNSYNPDADIYN